MKFTMEIDMDNDAFKNIPEMVLSDMLEKVGQRIERGAVVGKIQDFNGNTVGKFDIDCD